MQTLITLGESMNSDLRARIHENEGVENSTKVSLEANYQCWYTESFVVVKQLLPDRLAEFEQLYLGNGRRKEINISTYTIQDWLRGVRAATNRATGRKRFDDFAAMSMLFVNQLDILKSVQARFGSSLFDIRQMVQADLFDSDLDAARELEKQGFLRAAGTIAGVVLEKHLGQVMDNHNVKIRKRNPTISDFNDALKNDGVLDVPSWRQIQRLGDIRNLCSHSKEREPTREETDELIDGVDKYTKTLF